MNFRQFKYVLTIAECRNFSKAATKLFIAQPSLSQYITNLELRLGVKLFDRTTNPLRLTRAGELYVETAKKILLLGDQLTQQIADMADVVEGNLIIGASPYRCKYIIPRVLHLFQKRHPEVNVILTEKGRIELQELLLKGSIDICLTNAPLQEANFEYLPLLSEEILLALPPNYPLKDKNVVFGALYPSVSLYDFKDEPFVLLEPDQSLHNSALELCSSAGFKPRVVLKNRSFEASLAMVMANIGITFIPDTLAKFSSDKNHPLFCSIAESPSSREILIAYRKGRYISKAALEFISMALDIFNSTISDNKHR